MDQVNVDNTQNRSEKKEMKKSAKIVLLVLSLLFFVAAIVTPILVFALPGKNNPNDKQLGDFILRYDAKADRYDIVRYIGDDVEVVVPSEMPDGIKVRAILPNAFDASKREYSSTIEKITIEDGITAIGESAFKDCSALKELTIPQSVGSIDKNAFEGSGIEVLTVKDASTLKFLPGALEGAENLKTLNIVGASEKLGAGTLSNVTNITDVIISSGVEVDAGAFTGASSVTTLTVYNYSNLVIDQDAFENSNISTLNIRMIEENLTESFMQKFRGLANLKNVNVEKGISKIETFAFRDFVNLEKIVVGDASEIDISAIPTNEDQYKVKVELLGEEGQTEFTLNITNEAQNAFYNTLSKDFLDSFEFGKITNVILSVNFTTLDDSAFAAYEKLKNVNFGENSKISFIGTQAFGGSVVVENLDVVGPTSVSSKVYEEFNMSKGTYASRHSYNGNVDKGSYYVNINFMTGMGNGPDQADLDPKYVSMKNVEILIGRKIKDELPKDKIVTRVDGSIDKEQSELIASGWKIVWCLDSNCETELGDQLMSKEYSEFTFYAKWMWLTAERLNYAVNMPGTPDRMDFLFPEAEALLARLRKQAMEQERTERLSHGRALYQTTAGKNDDKIPGGK